jgi:hypothetical protein
VACVVSATTGGAGSMVPPSASTAAGPNNHFIAHQLSPPDVYIQAIRVAPSRQSLLDWMQTLPPAPDGHQRREYLPVATDLRVLRRYFHIRPVPGISGGAGCLESFPCHAATRELNPPQASGLPVNAWQRCTGLPGMRKMLRIRVNPRLPARNLAAPRGCWSSSFRRQAAPARSGKLMPSALLDGA